jgi:tetratricopeptide (TPR) repeat protein
MGRKQSGRRKQICLCVAILIFLTPLSCTFSEIMRTRTVNATGDEAWTHLVLARKCLARGDYGSALRENEKVISLAGKNLPVDEPLLNIGVIYAHPANPARDYEKSQASFRRLIRDYPESPLIEQAKTMVGLQQENDKLNHTVDRLSNTIDELKKTVAKLNTVIDELKNVDIGVDQKKRENTK